MASFNEFAALAIPRLRRVAYAYRQDWHHTDDVVQGALERVYTAWSRVRPPDAYGYTLKSQAHAARQSLQALLSAPFEQGTPR